MSDPILARRASFATMPDHHAVSPLDRPSAVPFMDKARDAILDDLMEYGYWPTTGRYVVEVCSYYNDCVSLPETDNDFRGMWNAAKSVHAWMAIDEIKARHKEAIRAWIPYEVVAEEAERLADEARETEWMEERA